MAGLRSTLLASSLALAACGPAARGARHVPDPHLIVPGVRVGPYVLDQTQRVDVLDDGTPEARAKLARAGLSLEFERGGTLTGVTVETDRFHTKEGLAVGAARNQVQRALGLPLQAEIGDEPRTARADHPRESPEELRYEGIAFLLDGEVVRAIRVP